ncbi:flagellar biosynthesis protein FlgN [Buchnera aphidicola (Hyadaphis tataricae)]|uniref:Flagellar biosynthesis protein FlgN n=1 Tax=Buchnera aphidicola (Hyadaphis tataricae) TaxID=1241859 RepID=A0A4D6XYN3_9GAMM|nr:flagellar export chaperone FlgN [Buchnera aphidicola]QCI21633.1 flagellar biosynthesis protein FlgN [Buchnera aphidicola (Hyadaphis tataricae)]
MKLLTETINKKKIILIALEKLLNKERYTLLNSNSNIDQLKLIFQEKTILFKKFLSLHQDRLLLETKYNIFAPYKNQEKLNISWNFVVKKCIVVKKIHGNNKVIINKKFCLNQSLLELFSQYRKSITYNIDGQLKM